MYILTIQFRSSGDTLTRENFYKLKARIAEARLLTMNHQHQINNCGNENDNGKGTVKSIIPKTTIKHQKTDIRWGWSCEKVESRKRDWARSCQKSNNKFGKVH